MIGRIVLPGSLLTFACASVSKAQVTRGVEKVTWQQNSCIFKLLTLMTSDCGSVDIITAKAATCWSMQKGCGQGS